MSLYCLTIIIIEQNHESQSVSFCRDAENHLNPSIWDPNWNHPNGYWMLPIRLTKFQWGLSGTSQLGKSEKCMKVLDVCRAHFHGSFQTATEVVGREQRRHGTAVPPTVFPQSKQNSKPGRVKLSGIRILSVFPTIMFFITSCLN